MPYIIGFSKTVQVADPDLYFNDCCIGGDVVLDRLLPVLRVNYREDLQANQEDWGWFAWFDKSAVKLAVDIHTDEHDLAQFQVHLTSSRARFLFGPKVQDTPELEELRDLVLSQLNFWPVANLTTERVDEKCMPIKTGG